MSLRRFVLLACWAMLVGSCGSGESRIVAPTIASRRLSVDGARLRDELGREVILRGFGAGSRAKMADYLPFELAPGADLTIAADAYFARFEALGANVVRLVFSWEAYEPTHGARDATYLSRYRALLDAAHEHGVAVIVEFHQDVFSSAFCGDGFPEWALGTVTHGAPHYDCGFPWWSISAFAPTSGVSQAFDRLWTNAGGLQDEMESMWRDVAGALGDHPAVAAFEIMNEPAPGSASFDTLESTILPAFYARMGAAIRAEAGDFAILWDDRIGGVGVPPALVPPTLEGAVFAPHYYESSVTTGATSVPEATVRSDLDATFAPMTTWSMPVFLGEFGVPNSSSIKAPYLDFVLDRVDEHRGHACVWEASDSTTLWNGEDFSVFDGSGVERDWAGSVVRAYPRAVAGDIARFAWDADAKTFELDVTAAIDGVTEIYLPARHLGTSPTIEVTNARFRFDVASETLLVVAAPGEDFTVRVGP